MLRFSHAQQSYNNCTICHVTDHDLQGVADEPFVVFQLSLESAATGCHQLQRLPQACDSVRAHH